MNIYDFDGTIYHGDSTADFIRFAFSKKLSLIAFLPIQAKAFVLYMTKHCTKTQMKEQFYRMLEGFDAPGLLEEFWDRHQHKIYPWYPEQQQEDDIIISASPEFLLRPICDRLGIRHLIASRVDPKTGAYTGENCWGPEKVIRLKDEMGITHCHKFFSDSHSDQPLADIADEAFLVAKQGKVIPWN